MVSTANLTEINYLVFAGVVGSSKEVRGYIFTITT